ncbi:hypothetical protein [Marinobacter adhaerens]|uniref:hypothetical protein n=1 Tax=Marinobacter adhaerens TaxID=1033846 RepID=UPI003D0AAD82
MSKMQSQLDGNMLIWERKNRLLAHHEHARFKRARMQWLQPVLSWSPVVLAFSSLLGKEIDPSN